MNIINKLIFGLCAFLSCGVALAAPINVSDAYIRETIPGTTISSAYMTIENTTDKQRKLVGVSSNISKRIELHEHSMANGMMQMQQVESIIIKAKENVVLQPHGYHIMIFNLDTPLRAEQQVELTLLFANGDTQSITVPVKGKKQLKHHHH